MRYCSSSDDAEEILNEGFLKVFQRLHTYDAGQPFKAWLRTLLINTAISHYHRNAKYTTNTIGLEDTVHPQLDDGIIERITAEEILKLIQQIKPLYRIVFLLYVVDGYNYREIADLLKINEATVRSHYARARAGLQQLIRQYYPELHNKADNLPDS